MCRPCAEFTARCREVAECGTCQQRLPLLKGYCRPCWVQAQLDRPTGPNTMLLPHVKRVRQHQLCFTGMPLQRTPDPRRDIPEVTPTIAARPLPQHVQLLLFTDLPRAYRYGMVDRRDRRSPANPWLRWALHIATTMAETRVLLCRVLAGLRRSSSSELPRISTGDPMFRDTTKLVDAIRAAQTWLSLLAIQL